jgi:Ca2+-binding RTX toxin-like protein
VSDWSDLYGNPWGDLSTFQSLMTGSTILRNAANDRFYGSNGDDLLRGGRGNDWIGAMQGNDWIDGGRGHDTVMAGGGEDFVQGGDGADWLYGESGNDWLDGGGGADHLNGGTGDDKVNAWTGDDELRGADGNDTLDGGPGSDIVYGGAGNDQLWAGSDGTDVLYGGPGDNTFYGWQLAPVIQGRYGPPAGSTITYQLSGHHDTVWDDGINLAADTLVYNGQGSADVHWFGGATQILSDPNYALPPYAASGTSDKVVLNNVVVGGNRIDSFDEFKEMIDDGRIGFQSNLDAEDGYHPLDGTSYQGHWTHVGNITLDFGPAADGSPRLLAFSQTSLSGIDGAGSLSPNDWIVT